MRAEDRVLLVDLENTVGALRPRPPLVRARIGALRAAAGDVHHALATYAAADPAVDVVASVLAELGVAPWPVPPGPDAAETVLLQHARYVASRGGHTFLVASGDGALADLAQLGRLEVLAWDRQPVSRRLQHAAAELHRIPWPTPDQATAGHRAGGTVAGETEDQEDLDLVDEQVRARAGRRRRRRVRVEQLLTAAATGAGMAAGARLLDQILPRRR